MKKLYCSSLSGWYCVAKFDKENKKISWIPKDDGPGSKLKKCDIEIILSALISKKGSIYESCKDMDLYTLEVVVKKRIKLKV